jgi:hypothetical protein
MTAIWWAGVPPVELAVTCAGQTHRLRWTHGELDTPDHADPSGERALAALGGQPHRCIEIIDAWARHADDLDMLLLASRGPSDPILTTDHDNAGPRGGMSFAGGGARIRSGPRHVAAARASMITTRSQRWIASFARSGAVPAPLPLDGGDEVTTLLTLGSGLPHRLVATVAATWAARLEQGDDRAQAAMPALHAALYGRAVAAARVWLDDADLDADATMCPPDAQATATRELGRVRLALPFSWLTDVWARGLATVAGRFCLAATLAGPDRWTLSTIGPDFGPPQTVIIDAS